jgi:hypothetical protein
MDYCDGEPLDVILEREITLDEERIMKFLEPLLDGLELVHATDVIHRDIKPGNIFIKSDGSPVLLDFGAARADMSSHSRSVTSLATPGYAAVEQYATRGRLGPWSDIYGLGATLYRCVTGAKPQGALDRQLEDELEPASKLAQGKYSANFLHAIDWSLGVRSEQRPQSIKLWREKLFATSVTEKVADNAYAAPVKPPFQQPVATVPASSSSNNTPRIIAIVAFAVIAIIFLLAKALNSEQPDDMVFDAATAEAPAAEAPAAEAPAAEAPPAEAPPAPVPAAEAPLIPPSPDKQYVTNFVYGDGVYTGQVVDGVPEGKGEYSGSNGLVDKGRFVRGQLNGKGTRTWATGNKHIGNFLNGACSGFGTTYYPGGAKFEAMWVDCGTGEGTFFEKNGSSWGRSCREGTCIAKSDEAPSAPAIAASAEQYVTNMAFRGGTYTGMAIDGVPNGKGEYRWNSGTIDKGNFVQGALSGRGTRIWSNGVKHIGQFANDICSGDGIQFYTNNSKFDAKWTDCQSAEGNYIFENGVVERSKLIDGKWVN